MLWPMRRQQTASRKDVIAQRGRDLPQWRTGFGGCNGFFDMHQDETRRA